MTHRILPLPPCSYGEWWSSASRLPNRKIPGRGVGPCVKCAWRKDSGSAVCGDGLLHLILLKCESASFGLHNSENTTIFQFQCSWTFRHWRYGESCYSPPLFHTLMENKLDYSWRTFLKIGVLSTQTKGSILFFSLGLSFFFCTFYSHSCSNTSRTEKNISFR